MASLSLERGKLHRIHWKFTVRVGPRIGETLEGSVQLGRCTKAAAKARLREIDAWEEAVKTGRHVPDRDLDSVVVAWLGERKLVCTPQTFDRTERVLRLYRTWREANGLPCRFVEDIANRRELISWRDHRLEKEAGRKTVANDLSTLSAFFQWCVIEKYLPDNPVARVARPRFVTKKEGRPLTRQQAGAWLHSIQPRTRRNGRGPSNWSDVRRKRRLVVFLLNTGIRNGELCALNIEDLRVDATERMIHVTGKGQKHRWVPLNRAAVAAVRLHLRSRGNPSSGPLLTDRNGRRYNVRQLASEIVQTARCHDGDVVVNPHNLRHTFATWLAKSGMDVSVIQAIMGHENVNTTLKYYVHTEHHELAGATANLRPKRPAAQAPPAGPPSTPKVIPFPKRHVG